MSNDALYLVKLNFQSVGVGGGSMVLQMTVNASDGNINGSASGTILEGTQHPPVFNAHCAGHLHATGFGSVTKVGALSGQAAVSAQPPLIGTYIAPFSATFAVNNEWTGTGKFSVGSDTYECQVSKAQ